MDTQEHKHGHARPHRETVASKLDQIAQLVRQRLTEHGIDVSVFFVVPSSGEAIVGFGTTSDPPDALWAKVGDHVCHVVRDTIGVERFRRRHVVCAAADGASP